ncbi:MAG: winged helix-turn-helix transcriptional regulator [Candidatus Omnitrophota bacterium]|jgi:DNA-binding MarR family transcriptional regulator|nr:MAG: winged helix-turn-helix transcriptional regulator [Candidatus Omnitrophota bacterium]
MNENLNNQENGVMDRDDQMILSLLTAITDEPETTQKDLSTRLGVAVGLVNSYLKRIIYKGYVKTKQLERRRLRYLLTPKGIKEKSRLTFEFLHYSYQYIREIRRNVKHAVSPFLRDGRKKVIFYGSGEVAELAYLAVRELGLELVSVIDPQHVGKRCVDHTICDLSSLTESGMADVLLVLESPAQKNSSEVELKRIADDLKMQYVSCFK